MNSFDDLTADCLGFAGNVYEHVLVSFVRPDKNEFSVLFFQCLR